MIESTLAQTDRQVQDYTKYMMTRQIYAKTRFVFMENSPYLYLLQVSDFNKQILLENIKIFFFSFTKTKYLWYDLNLWNLLYFMDFYSTQKRWHFLWENFIFYLFFDSEDPNICAGYENGQKPDPDFYKTLLHVPYILYVMIVTERVVLFFSLYNDIALSCFVLNIAVYRFVPLWIYIRVQNTYAE